MTWNPIIERQRLICQSIPSSTSSLSILGNGAPGSRERINVRCRRVERPSQEISTTATATSSKIRRMLAQQATSARVTPTLRLFKKIN